MKWQISSSWRNERTDMDYSKQNNDTKKKKKKLHMHYPILKMPRIN